MIMFSPQEAAVLDLIVRRKNAGLGATEATINLLEQLGGNSLIVASIILYGESPDSNYKLVKMANSYSSRWK
jgi:hypothetical protein